MTHCVDFWEKWKREPNFCGMGKSSARSYDDYIDFVETLSKESGIPSDIIYRNAPHAAVKPFLKFRRDSETRKIVERTICDTLNKKLAVTGKFLSSAVGVKSEPNKIAEEPKVIIAPMSAPHREIINKNSVRDKIRLLSEVLTKGQMNILVQVMETEGLEDEYVALSRVLVWAKERVDDRK